MPSGWSGFRSPVLSSTGGEEIVELAPGCERRVEVPAGKSRAAGNPLPERWTKVGTSSDVTTCLMSPISGRRYTATITSSIGMMGRPSTIKPSARYSVQSSSIHLSQNIEFKRQILVEPYAFVVNVRGLRLGDAHYIALLEGSPRP